MPKTLITTQHERQAKVNELKAVHDFLFEQPATATQVATALNIYRPNLCRRKRTLEIAGQLMVIKKTICPITRHTAGLLTTNPALFPIQKQLKLF